MIGSVEMRKGEKMDKDVIYRQDAIDALDCINGTEEVLRSLPSASKRKTGQWIMKDKGLAVTSYKCSECGRIVRDDTGYDVSKDYPFCHCGAKMVDPQESEDKKKLSWIGKRCEDCGNKKCKELGELPKGYDCALWQAEREGQE